MRPPALGRIFHGVAKFAGSRAQQTCGQRGAQTADIGRLGGGPHHQQQLLGFRGVEHPPGAVQHRRHTALRQSALDQARLVMGAGQYRYLLGLPGLLRVFEQRDDLAGHGRDDAANRFAPGQGFVGFFAGTARQIPQSQCFGRNTGRRLV